MKSMKWRAIFRFSFDKDIRSKVRNEVIRKLEECGFSNTRTGAWETPLGDPVCISNTVAKILDELAHLSVDGGEFSVDHMWLYVDKVLDEGAPATN